MNEYPRLPPRLSRIFTSNPVFLVTFCAYRRRKFLATNSVNAALRDFGTRAYEQYSIAFGRYVIMPDHLHLFVCGPMILSWGAGLGY